MAAFKKSVCGLLIIMCLCPLVEAEEQTVTISYLERPPYYYDENGKAKGILLELTIRIFEKAGVAYRLRVLPPKRIVMSIKSMDELHCSPGWFKNDERQNWANFSLAFYRNRSLVLLTNPVFQGKISKYTQLADVFRDHELIMGIVSTFRYGDYVDNVIKELHPEKFEVISSQKQLIRLLHLNRISYMIISPEEIDSLIATEGLNRQEFVAVNFADIPPGNKRYLMCSKNVDEAILERLNNAIKELVSSDIWKE